MEIAKILRLNAARIEELKNRGFPDSDIEEDIGYHLKTIQRKRYSSKLNSFYKFFNREEGDRCLWFTFKHKDTTYCAEIKVPSKPSSISDHQLLKDGIEIARGNLYQLFIKQANGNKT